MLLEEIRTATPRRKWESAYIIGTYPDRIDRERMSEEYGVELVHIDTPKEVCIERAIKDISRSAVRDAVLSWIENYWRRYRE